MPACNNNDNNIHTTTTKILFTIISSALLVEGVGNTGMVKSFHVPTLFYLFFTPLPLAYRCLHTSNFVTTDHGMTYLQGRRFSISSMVTTIFVLSLLENRNIYTMPMPYLHSNLWSKYQRFNKNDWDHRAEGEATTFTRQAYILKGFKKKNTKTKGCEQFKTDRIRDGSLEKTVENYRDIVNVCVYSIT